ncbi:MAG TPA: hypothetical protein VGO91_07445 [Pyrinomonadaceae bacterium]|jgi:hypothetical protein|nr:hypothetical protein [Pyrinomonadaceae bacterium]
MTTATIAPPIPESPFRGIEPLRFVDQLIFTARESEIWNLVSSITIHRGVLLYGDSGTGKSSLVNAGLIPRLLEEDYIPDRLRAQPRLGREIKVERISTAVNGQPPYLDSILARDETTPSFEISVEEFLDRLQSLPKSAGTERAASVPLEVKRPILIFDQFEEFITLFEEAMRAGETREAQEAAQAQEKIQRALVGLIRDQTLPVKILLVFREDYLAKLNVLFEHCPNLLDQYLRLRSPRVEELKHIIRAPFEKKELREKFVKVQAEGGSELSEELAQRVSAELSKRSEGGRANLSELQIVCRKLWESSDPDALFQQKGVQGLLEQYLSASVQEFSEDLRDPAVALLGHMITSSGTRNIVSQDDLLKNERANFSEERIERALEALTNSKLVTLEVRRNVYFYEIVSEFLIPWIKEQEAARRALIERRQLEEEAAKKAEQARLEAEKKAEQDKLAAELKLARQQKRSILIGSLAVLSLLMLLSIGGLLYARQRRAARLSAQQAIEAKLQADKEAATARSDMESAAIVADKLTKVTSRAPADKLEALENLDSLVNEEKINPHIALAILSIAVRDTDETVSDKASEIIQQSVKSNDALGQAFKGAADSKTGLAQTLETTGPARFYIKLANDEQRKRADKIREALEEKGYIVAPYEQVGGGAPAINKLRHSSPTENGDLSPDAILDLLKQADGPGWTKEPLGTGKARPRTFEIWFAREVVSPGNLIFNFKDNEGDEITNVKFSILVTNISSGISSKTALPSGGQYLLPPGKYRLTVRGEGYNFVDKVFSINAGKDTQMDLTMSKK